MDAGLVLAGIGIGDGLRDFVAAVHHHGKDVFVNLDDPSSTGGEDEKEGEDRKLFHRLESHSKL
jgi:hypothetical protein